jgi:hypothetical protein
MKTKKLAVTAALVLAGVAFIGSTAKAQVSASTGDLILAFRTTDNSVPYNLEVDLGQASQFVGLPGGTVLDLSLGGSYFGSTGGLAAADLATVFSSGSNWNQNSNLVWSVAGTNGPAGNDTLWATFASTAQNDASKSTQATPASKLSTEETTISGQTSLTSPQAAEIASGANGSYTTEITYGGTAKNYNYFYSNNSTETSVVSSGDATLNLYQLTAGSGPAVEIGTFDLGSSGSLTFTSVPEPSTYAMALGGLGMLIGAQRLRRRNGRQLPEGKG